MTTTNQVAKGQLYQIVTDQIIALLESQQLTWDQPWVVLSSDGKRAHNALSGRQYSGLNHIILSMRQAKAGYPYSGWMTFGQVQRANGHVRQGERSSQIYFHRVFYYDVTGKRYEAEEVEKMSAESQLELDLIKRYVLKCYHVFNVAQTSDLPEAMYELSDHTSPSRFEMDQNADQLIESTGAVVNHWPGNAAYYNRLEDIICLPERQQFKGQESYYATVLHELAHWTGHSSRLDREMFHVFGTTGYAKEELIAELCSAYLCAELGFSKVITNNAAYIQDWIRVLRQDTRYIFIASSAAEKATRYILSHRPASKE